MLAAVALVIVGGVATASPGVLPVQGTFDLSAVSCTSSSYCLAVGGDVSTLLVNGQEGGGVTIPGEVNLTAMACPTSADCFAVGQEDASDNPPGYTDGIVVPFIYGEAQSPIEVPDTSDLSAIGCTPGTTSCVAVGDETYSEQTPPYRYGTVVNLSDGAPAGAVQQEPAFISLSAISCPDATTCFAAGETAGSSASAVGGILPVTSGTAGSDQTVPSVYNVSAIACISSAQCWAAGVGASGGEVIPLTSGTPGTPVAISGISSFSNSATCPTSSQCYVTGQNSDEQGFVLPITAGVPGTPQVDLSGSEASVDGLSCVTANECIGSGSENGTGVLITSAVQESAASVTSVGFSGTGYAETVTIRGANFSPWAPEASPVSPVSCVPGSPSYDYPSGVLSFTDTTGSWSAGTPGDCTGLVVKSWSDTKVVLGFGAGYVWPLLQPHDAYQVSILGTAYSGTASIPAVPAPAVKSVVVHGTPSAPVVTVTGTNLGTRVPVPDPLTPVNCVAGDTSHTYPSGQLSFSDTTRGWQAGLTGDCIGLVVTSWSSTKVVLGFGADYPNFPPVTKGDAIRVVVKGATATGSAGA
jgi:hypothetical protein